MLRTTTRTAAAAGVVAALGLAFGLSPASATKTVNIPSKVSIKSKELTFSGKVTASNAGCVQGRRVTLYRKFSSGGGQSMGSATTSSSGKWHVTVSGTAGISLAHFYAKVKKRSEGTAGTIYVCGSARSKTIGVSP
ncbi:MAG: hypothetical protein QOJ07_1217 [Thermoleophilaceae bacterium]|jgi:hypothetical protein|nr:hypothetical protein [Thermoleophilaceae bacterium]